MPRVAQVSSPSAFTSRIISATLGMSRSLGERHAAPMQKRLAPAALAWRAFSSTSPVAISLVASTPVWYRWACGQYAQSSGQPPVLTDSSVLTCTSAGSKCARCTVAAWCSSSGNGRSNRDWISSRLQSVRGAGDSLTADMAFFRLLWRDRPASLESMSTAVNQTTPAKVDGLRRRIGFWLRNDAAALLWPGRCLVCEEEAGEAIDLCERCVAGLPWLGPACLRCAMPLPFAHPPGAACGACQATPPPLDQVHAAYLYAAPLDRLVPRFKFHRDLA